MNTLVFVLRYTIVGLAIAFVVVYLLPSQQDHAPRRASNTTSYATAVARAAPAVARCDLDVAALYLTTAKVVLLPVALGAFLRARFPKQVERAMPIAT